VSASADAAEQLEDEWLEDEHLSNVLENADAETELMADEEGVISHNFLRKGLGSVGRSISNGASNAGNAVDNTAQDGANAASGTLKGAAKAICVNFDASVCHCRCSRSGGDVCGGNVCVGSPRGGECCTVSALLTHQDEAIRCCTNCLDSSHSQCSEQSQLTQLNSTTRQADDLIALLADSERAEVGWDCG